MIGVPAKRTIAPALGLRTSSIMTRALRTSLVRATVTPSSLSWLDDAEVSAILTSVLLAEGQR